jgi:hypothetical protein
VSWTPVFARGKVKIYMCGLDDSGPDKLTDGVPANKFVSDVLPRVLAGMKGEFGWTSVPKVVVHDKASYFVNHQNARLQTDFDLGLRTGGFRSWVGEGGPDATWLAARLGDFYPHETLISHIRRLLTHKFLHTGNKAETPIQFRRRLDLVEGHLNSGAWANGDSEALVRLAKSYHDRAAMVRDNDGDRIPK